MLLGQVGVSGHHDDRRRGAPCCAGRCVWRYSRGRNVVRLSGAPAQGGAAGAGRVVQASRLIRRSSDCSTRTARTRMNRRTIAQPVSLDGDRAAPGRAVPLAVPAGAKRRGHHLRARRSRRGADDPGARRARACSPNGARSSARIRCRCTRSSTCSPRSRGCGIDDVVIELDGPEPPIMDGSAAPFVDALRDGGFVEQPGEVQYLHAAPTPVRVADGESRLRGDARARTSSWT